jgi:hypothetical protein
MDLLTWAFGRGLAGGDTVGQTLSPDAGDFDIAVLKAPHTHGLGRPVARTRHGQVAGRRFLRSSGSGAGSSVTRRFRR